MIEPKKVKQSSIIWKRFKRNKIALFGFAILLLVFLSAVLAPIISPYNPSEIVMSQKLRPPSWEHLLGTDELGRDVLSRIIFGSRTALLIGFGASGLASLVGIILGAVSGYYRGFIDDVIMRLCDTFLVIPYLFLYILIIAMLRERSIWVIMTITGLLMWPRLSRIVRSEFLSLREREYAKAAKAVGASDVRIIFKHLLPNALSSIIVTSTFNVAVAILMETTLSFLGFGDPTICSWGIMVALGRDVLSVAWWVATFPGIAIFLTVFGLNLVGDGLRDAVDPRLK